jgi:hypothetical protein
VSCLLGEPRSGRDPSQLAIWAEIVAAPETIPAQIADLDEAAVYWRRPSRVGANLLANPGSSGPRPSCSRLAAGRRRPGASCDACGGGAPGCDSERAIRCPPLPRRDPRGRRAGRRPAVGGRAGLRDPPGPARSSPPANPRVGQSHDHRTTGRRPRRVGSVEPGHRRADVPSRRTVQSHVSHILTKTGLASSVTLAAAVASRATSSTVFRAST